MLHPGRGFCTRGHSMLPCNHFTVRAHPTKPGGITSAEISTFSFPAFLCTLCGQQFLRPHLIMLNS